MRDSSWIQKHWFILAALALAVLVILYFLLVGFARRTIQELANRSAQPLSLSEGGGAFRSASKRSWHRIWTWPSGAPLSGTPVPLDDGWVAATQDGRILALNSAGRPRWLSVCSNLVFTGSPVVAGDSVVVATGNGTVVALDAVSGQHAWQTTLVASFRHGPLAVRRGDAWQVILLSATDGVLHALDAQTGRATWQAEATNRSDGAPASDGRRLAFGNCDAALQVFDAGSGARLSRIPVGADAQMAGGVLLQGSRAYAGTRAGKLACLDLAADRVAWSAAITEGEAFVTPVAARQAVVMGAPDGTVAAFTATSGAALWRVSVGHAVTALCAQDDAVFAVAGGSLVGLRVSDGGRFASLPMGDNVLGPVCNDRGIVVVADDGGSIIAVTGE